MDEILYALSSRRGTGFQEDIAKYLKIKYPNGEEPKGIGGDGGVDFIVDNTYYQIATHEDATKDNKKYFDDLKKVLETVYIKNQYTQKVEKYIFIIQTHRNELPNTLPRKGSARYDNDNEIKLKKIVGKIFEDKDEQKNFLENFDHYALTVENLLSDTRYKEDLLFQIKINSKFDIRVKNDPFAIIKAIEYSKEAFDSIEYQFDEVSEIREETKSKIKYHEIDIYKNIIENLITDEAWINVIDEYIKRNTDANTISFNKIKRYVVHIYKDEIKHSHYADDTIENMMKKLSDVANIEESSSLGIIVYILDKCDIFKEE